MLFCRFWNALKEFYSHSECICLILGHYYCCIWASLYHWMGRKVTAFLGPPKLLAPLCWMFLNQYLVLHSLFPVDFCLPGWSAESARVCLFFLTKVWLLCQKYVLKLQWIAFLSSAYQIIRCLPNKWVFKWEVWVMCLKWEFPKYFKCVMIASLEGGSKELILGSVLALPKVGFHPQDQPRTPVLSPSKTVFPNGLLEDTTCNFHSLSLVTRDVVLASSEFSVLAL